MSAEAVGQGDVESAAAHPEEMRASFILRIGDRAVLEGSARTTPAGVISTGIAVGAALGGFLGQIAPEGLLDDRTPAILMSALGLGGLGALVAAGLAVWADKRSRRRPTVR